MTGPARAKKSSLALSAMAAGLAALALACGTSYYEIPIETPIQPKLDVTPFQRVLVVGFVAGGSEDVDTNQETVRLLRSQLHQTMPAPDSSGSLRPESLVMNSWY